MVLELHHPSNGQAFVWPPACPLFKDTFFCPPSCRGPSPWTQFFSPEPCPCEFPHCSNTRVAELKKPTVSGHSEPATPIQTDWLLVCEGLQWAGSGLGGLGRGSRRGRSIGSGRRSDWQMSQVCSSSWLLSACQHGLQTAVTQNTHLSHPRGEMSCHSAPRYPSDSGLGRFELARVADHQWSLDRCHKNGSCILHLYSYVHRLAPPACSCWGRFGLPPPLVGPDKPVVL